MNSLRVKGRIVEVDTTPLSAASANFRSKTMLQPRDGCLRLRPSGGLLLFAACFAAPGLVMATIGFAKVLTESPKWAAALLIPFGSLFVTVGGSIWLVPRRHEFDCDSGQFVTARLTKTVVRPLTDILAIQLLDGGWHDGGDGPGYNTYQFNLILDDAAEPRRCLSNHANLNATRRDAKRLAEFLGVPLFEHI